MRVTWVVDCSYHGPSGRHGGSTLPLGQIALRTARHELSRIVDSAILLAFCTGVIAGASCVGMRLVVVASSLALPSLLALLCLG